MNLYTDIDPKVCAWMQELVNDGLIPTGTVLCESVLDIKPNELKDYTQIHLFCGIGGWPYALKLAGWPEDRPVWTASCPCQPLSCAGSRQGHADERHLWPALYALIDQCRPAIVFGEQVASKDGREWLAGVRADLECLGYAVGAADLCAAGVQAPHIRQRLFWVGDAELRRHGSERDGETGEREPERGGERERLDHSAGARYAPEREGPELREQRSGQCVSGEGRQGGGMGDVQQPGLEEWPAQRGDMGQECSSTQRTGGALNFWSSSTWHPCRDGKVRRIPLGAECVLQWMADGVPAGMDPVRVASYGFPIAPKIQGRSGLLKGYGNAITPELAAAFVRAVMECL